MCAANPRLAYNIEHIIQKLAKQPVESLSVNEIARQQKKANWFEVQSSANWVQRELPVRIAHRLYEFNRLPFIVVTNPHIHKVYKKYSSALIQSFSTKTIETKEQETELSNRLASLVSGSQDIIRLMQKGISDLRASHPDIELNEFLDRLFLNRIGTRVLMEQHLSLHENFCNPDKSAGIINHNCSPTKMIEVIAKRVQEIAVRAYGVAPPINIGGDKSVVFSYVPEHLHFILLETLKNAVRATLDKHGLSEKIPPVKVGIFEGSYDVIVRISDEGGGISPDEMKNVFNYGFTTAAGDSEPSVTRENQREMAGYGFGLPLSKLYAKYFGGNLSVQSMAGVGCDVYILLNRIGDHRESIPPPI
eukprot:GHVL01022503.1.p1 GENE.GHVL01022503.1~~GHVL01022503.1.p1  ORF type:complete len:362 (+),score=56.29 GHVL01022503.1:154-1239(+)